MCFTCPATVVVAHPGYSVQVARAEDRFTRPSDLDLQPGLVAAHEAGHWLYVALEVTLVLDGAPGRSVTLYGVPEFGDAGCAFADDTAMQVAHDLLIAALAADPVEEYVRAAAPIRD